MTEAGAAPFVDDVAEAQRLLVRAEDFRFSQEDRLAALTYVLRATHASTLSALLIRCAKHLPHAFRTFPEREDEIYTAAYDLVENDEREVRLAAYPILAALARGARSEKIRESVDILLQSMLQPPPDSLTPHEKDAITASLLLVLEAQPRCFVDALVEWFPTAGTWEWLAEPRVKKAMLDVLCDKARSEDGAAERKFIFGVGSFFESAPLALRLTSLRYILPLPTITGADSTRAHPSHLLHLLINTALLYPDTADLLPVLSAIDDLAEATTPRNAPDPRWFLLLYARRPVMTAEWAHKGAVTRPGETPTRLIDWLLAGWALWRADYKAAKETGVPVELDEEIQFGRLGVEVAQTTMKQVGMMVPRGVSIMNIRHHLEAIEANLIMVYFIFLKMRGKVPNLCSDYERQRLADIRRVAAEGVEEARTAGPSSVPLKRWENVLEMSKQLLEPTTLTTVHPSWASQAAKQQAEAMAAIEVEMAATFAAVRQPAVTAPVTVTARSGIQNGPTTQVDASSTDVVPLAPPVDDHAMAVDQPLPTTKASRSRPTATMLMDGPVPSAPAVPSAAQLKRRESSPDNAMSTRAGGDIGRPKVIMNSTFQRLLGVPSPAAAPRRISRNRTAATVTSLPAVGIVGPVKPAASAPARPAFGIKGTALPNTSTSPPVSLAERLRGAASDSTSLSTNGKRKAEGLSDTSDATPAKHIRISGVAASPRELIVSPPSTPSLATRLAPSTATPGRAGRSLQQQTQAADPLFSEITSSLLERLGQGGKTAPTEQHSRIAAISIHGRTAPAKFDGRPNSAQVEHMSPQSQGTSLLARLSHHSGGSASGTRSPSTAQQDEDAMKGIEVIDPPERYEVPAGQSNSIVVQKRKSALRQTSDSHREALITTTPAHSSTPTDRAAANGTSVPLLERIKGGSSASTPSFQHQPANSPSHKQKSLLERLGKGAASPSANTPKKGVGQAAAARQSSASSPLPLAARLAQRP